MVNDNLKHLLAQVHDRLNCSTSLDADTRKLLTTVMHDIEKTLLRRTVGAPSTGSSLESYAVKLQAEHPALANALQQLVDALAKAGI